MKRSFLIAGLVLAQTFAMPAALAEPPSASSVPRTLAQALAMAWARAPAFRAQPDRFAQLDADASLAAGWTPGPPSVSLSNVNDRLNASTGRQAWEVELATPLWLPGQQAASQRHVQARVNWLAEHNESQRLELAGRVREVWWQLALARAQRQVAGDRVASAQALQADVERRWQAGDLARTDAHAARIDTQTAQAEQVIALREEQRALVAWRMLTGAPAPTELAAETPASADLGHQAHPRMKAASALVEVAHAQLRKTDQSRREAPEVAVRWIRERGAGHDPYANALGVTLKLPLSWGPKVNAERSGVLADLAEAQAELDLVREQLALEADMARQDVEAAARTQALSGSRAALTADTLRLLQKAFDLGEIDLPTLLRARASAFEAKAELASSTLARSAAISKLNQTLGWLP